MKRIKPEKIHMLAATVLKTSILPAQEYLEKREEPDNIAVGYSQESRFDFDEGIVLIILDIKLIGKDNDDKEIGLEGEYSIEFVFKIENSSHTTKNNVGRWVPADKIVEAARMLR